MNLVIHMKNGTSLSLGQAALNLFIEKELCSGPCRLRKDGTLIRDSIGVLENHTWNGERCVPARIVKNEHFRISIHAHNDTQPRHIGYKNDPASCKERTREMLRFLLKKKRPSY